MRFHLFYEGAFLAANGDPRGGQIDKKAPHKHMLRRAFHKQLRHQWRLNRFLRETETHGDLFGLQLDPRRPLVEVVKSMHPTCGFNWVPLVCKQFNVDCRLDILLMRRDGPNREKTFSARDLDNRLKTLFDALKMPTDVTELGVGVTPLVDEDPFFVLLQKDELISHVSVETTELLDPPATAGRDDSYARIVIDVTVMPHDSLMMFNLGFL